MKPIKGTFIQLLLFLLALNAIGSNASSLATPGGGGQRDLFDQMLNSLAAKYLPSYQGERMLGGVHPLPRQLKLGEGWEKRQTSSFANPASAAAASAADDEDQGGNGADGTLLSGLSAGAGNAIPASILAAAASPTSEGSSSDRSPSSSPSATASASATPLSKLITSAPPAPSPSTPPAASSSNSIPPSSSSTASAPSSTPTKGNQKSENDDDKDQNLSLLNPKHKLFPLIVAGIAAAGLLTIMLFIAIARAIAHESLRRDNLRKSYSFDNSPLFNSKGPSDKYTSPSTRGGGGVGRSLRRAITKKKQLGSFARRTQDGSVLIEVGDEVFAVPSHLADSYRERILREKRSRSTLTEDTMTRGGGGGLFGVKTKYLTDRGPDAYGGDEEQAKLAYDSMLSGNRQDITVDEGVGRSLSQRLGDRFKSLTEASGGSGKPVEEKKAFSFDIDHQNPATIRQTHLGGDKAVLTAGSKEWNIRQQDMTKTPSPPFGTAKVFQRSTSIPLPPTARTAPEGVKTAVEGIGYPMKSKPSHRKPPPKLELSLSLLTEKLQDLEKQSSNSSSSNNSHSSHKGTSGWLPKEANLTTSSGDSANGTFGGSQSHSEISLPGAFPERTKSLHHSTGRVRSIKPLILNIESASTAVGGYRGKKPETVRSKTQVTKEAKRGVERVGSVALASPTRFTHSKSARVYVEPEKPQPIATGGSRPLPVPPPFTLPQTQF